MYQISATRRAFWCVLIGLLYLVPLQSGTETTVEASDSATAEDHFFQPLINTLPDISANRIDEAVTLSLQPLTRQNLKKISYITEIHSEYTYFRPDTPPRKQEQDRKILREMAFLPLEQDGEIAYLERLIAMVGDDVPRDFNVKENKRIMGFNGRYMEAPNNGLKDYYREAGGVYPLGKLLRRGDQWTQPINVDPELNPGGRIDATLILKDVFRKDGKTYARVQRDHVFKAFRPDFKKTGTSRIDRDHTISYRVNEVWDLCVDTGVIVDKNTITRVLFHSIGAPQLNTDSNANVVEQANREIETMLVQIIARERLDKIELLATN